jgi:hypothetical protein
MANIGAGAAATGSEQYLSFLEETDKAFGSVFAGPSFRAFQHKYGPMLFPAVLSGLLAICLGACVISGSLRSISRRDELSRTAMLDMSVLIGCVVLYILTAEIFGFVLSAAVILLVLFRRMHVGSRIAIPATILLAALVYQLFAVGLRVPLPRGLFGW